MRNIIRAGIALLTFVSVVCFSGWQLASLSVDDKQMTDMFVVHAETPGVGAEQYPELAGTITAYLSGDTDSMHLDIEENGKVAPAFGERETAHMQDVRDLVALGQSMRWALLTVLVLALVLFMLRQGGILLITARDAQLGFSMGVLAFYLVLITITSWALVDFDGLFTLLHERIFVNDLWLLNPREDLLIQLMPESFFAGYGWLFLKHNAFFYLGTMLAALYFLKRKPSGEQAA